MAREFRWELQEDDPENHKKRRCHVHPGMNCLGFECMAYVPATYETIEPDVDDKKMISVRRDGGRCGLVPVVEIPKLVV